MGSIQDFAKSCTPEIQRFLEEHLPAVVGPGWWEEAVLPNLSEMQRIMIDRRGVTDLAGLDLMALLAILERNWRTLSNQIRGIDYRESLNQIFGLKNIRNYYAHEPSSGTPLDRKLQDVGTIIAFIRIFNPDSDLIAQGEQLRNSLMLEMLQQAGLTGDITSVTSGSPESEADQDSDQESAECDGSEISSGQEEAVAPENEAEEAEGVPLAWLKAGSILDQEILKNLDSATYVGIDFGTSTSVASIAKVEKDGKGLCTYPIEVLQADDLGREIHSHLVDTCLAWVNNSLLFGVGAAALKQELVSNQTVWTSFKMGLGVDLGPEYNRTALPDGKFEYTIEKPQQAAAVFLKLLCDGIRDYVKKHNLPKQIFYTVTVPASFEANQRNDLFAALKFAGIEENEIRLLDEPNAAFLSYLIDMESRSTDGQRFVDVLQNKSRNVMVFDFGAGTCDISILEVSTSNNSILSRNLGISKFWALGGDDIDKIIADKILLPQLCGGENLAKYMFTTTQLEQQVLPHLKPVAEALKIRCCEVAEQKNYTTIEHLRNADEKITVKAGKPFSVQGQTRQIDEPQITMAQFAEIIALFVDENSKFKRTEDFIDVLRPIDNALQKVDLEKDDIDMVLFIGGSSENPIIRNYVSKHLGRFVDCVVPTDLRAHVSQGAAAYTLLLRGAKVDPIRPIISETIYILTSGEILEPVIRAGTTVPSEGRLESTLKVVRNNQKVIDLPFLSGSINKPLGIVQIKAPAPRFTFEQGEEVKITWSYSKEKILSVTAETAHAKQSANFLNPLVNEEVTEEVMAMLKAKQAFNQSVLDGNGRPSATAARNYSNAARKAGHWRLAAEMLEAVEKLDPGSDHSTSICYCYSMDGDNKNSYKWSKIAHERGPCATTAFNLALDHWRNKNIDKYEQLMEECLEHDPDYTAALVAYGDHLQDKGDVLGSEYLERAFDIFKQEMEDKYLEGSDISRFNRTARALGREEILADINRYATNQNRSRATRSGYKAENLVGSNRSHAGSKAD